MPLNEIIKKEIDKLPGTDLDELFEYIQFLKYDNKKTMLAKALQDFSLTSFQKVRNNPEDAVYDGL